MKTLRRLNFVLRPYRLQIVLGALILIALTGVEMVFPSIIQQVIDIGLKPGQGSLLLALALLVAGLGLLRAILSFFERYLTEWVANQIAFDLRNRLYDHIQRLSFTFHDHSQSGQLISRTIEDVRSLQSFSGHGFSELLRVILLLIGIVTIMFITNPGLAWIALLPMIPLVMITLGFSQRIGTMFLKVDNLIGDLSSRLQENVTGVQVVRAFARESHEMQRFGQKNRDLYNAQVGLVGEWAKIMPTTTFLVTFGTILILWFGGQMVLQGNLTLGELVAFNAYMLLLAMPSQQIGWLVNAAGEASAGLQRAFEVLDTPADIRTPQNAFSLPLLQGQVEFEGVDFHYRPPSVADNHEDLPSLEPQITLTGINLLVKPNQVIALIGPTGSGKTSLINLIPRFYDVTHGRILVDGRDVRQVDLLSLRRQIGIVLQTSLLFSASVRDNLAYGRPEASMEEVISVAKAAQAHDFIMQLPQQYETVVGERGITLSGGQRQRIAIGRALLMNPRILILDDSTSSVDSETEQLIQKALNHLMNGRTTFVIAQRLSTVRKADKIVVLENGRIVQSGTHQQLLTEEGLYRQIYELQLRDQEEFFDDHSLTEDTAPTFEPVDPKPESPRHREDRKKMED